MKMLRYIFRFKASVDEAEITGVQTCWARSDEDALDVARATIIKDLSVFGCTDDNLDVYGVRRDLGE